MTGRARISLLSANLLAGGIGRSRTEQRFAPLLEALAEQEPDVLALQECLYWDQDEHRLWDKAQQRLGMSGVLGISADTGMHTALLVRAPLRIAAHRVDHGKRWHHSVTHALVVWDEHGALAPGRLRVASIHLAPRNPLQRDWEAGELTDYAASDDPAVLLGDTNTPDRHTNLDDAPAHVLARYARVGTRIPDCGAIDRLVHAGMTDLADTADTGAVDLATSGAAPARTTGHWPGHRVYSRPDRILANPAAAALLHDYTVITAAGHLSDHHWPQASLRPTPAVAPRPPADAAALPAL